MSDALLHWPEWMPPALQSGYGYEPVDRTVSSEMDIGTIKRVEFDTDENTVTCQLMLDTDELAWFEVFERDLLRQGSRWFLLPVLLGGDIQEHKVRIRGRPKFGQVHGRYMTVSLSLETEKRKLMDADLAELLLIFGPHELRAVSDRLHEVVHVEMPYVTSIPGYWQ